MAQGKKTGRPSKYSQELADKICERIELGESLRGICRDDDMPDHTTVIRWKQNNDQFHNQYARAKEEQADSYEDMMLETAHHEEDVQRARLIIDTMKWTASKLKPKKYGDKIDHTTNGKDMPAPILSTVVPPTTDVIDLN